MGGFCVSTSIEIMTVISNVSRPDTLPIMLAMIDEAYRRQHWSVPVQVILMLSSSPKVASQCHKKDKRYYLSQVITLHSPDWAVLSFLFLTSSNGSRQDLYLGNTKRVVFIVSIPVLVVHPTVSKNSFYILMRNTCNYYINIKRFLSTQYLPEAQTLLQPKPRPY